MPCSRLCEDRDAGNANLVSTPAITDARDGVPGTCIFVSPSANLGKAHHLDSSSTRSKLGTPKFGHSMGRSSFELKTPKVDLGPLKN